MKTRYQLITAALAAMLLIAVLLTFLLREGQDLYRVTVLPSLGGKLTVPTALNDQGTVVGWAAAGDGEHRLFLWNREQGMQDLGSACQSFSGFVWKSSPDINNEGQIAATIMGPDMSRQAALRDPHGAVRVLGTLGGHESIAWALNNLGQVVGSARTAETAWHAFVWDRASGMRDLGTLGGKESRALDIDDTGCVLGLADTRTSRLSPCLWNQMDTTASALPSGSHGDLNDRGDLFGQLSSGPGKWFLVAWRRHTRVERLFAVGDGTAADVRCNDANQVAYMQVHSTWLKRVNARYFPLRVGSYLWDPRRGRIALDRYVPREEDESFFPVDLNDKGAIAGVVHNRDYTRIRGILLEPIPERWGK